MSWGSRHRRRAGAVALVLAGGLVLSACSSGTVVRQSLGGTKTAAVAGCPAGPASSVSTCEDVLSAFRRTWATFDQVWSSVPVRKTATLPAKCDHLAPGTKAPAACEGDVPLLAQLVSVATPPLVYGYWGPKLIAPVMLAGDKTQGGIQPLDPAVVYVGAKPPLTWKSSEGTLRLAAPPSNSHATLAVVKACLSDSLSVTRDGKSVPLVVGKDEVLVPGGGYNPIAAMLEQFPNGSWALAEYSEGGEIERSAVGKGGSPCGAGW